jgi:hypothetical protein
LISSGFGEVGPEGRELVEFFKTSKRGVIPLGRGSASSDDAE